MKPILLAAALGALALPASAQVVWSGEAGVATDYVKRGFSRSDDTAHVFAGATAGAGALYAGAWASNVDLGDADAEVDLYAGWRPEVRGYQLDFSAARNAFLGDGDLSYWDVQAQASREVGPARGAVLAGFSPDYLGGDEAWWVQADASVELYRRWTLSVTLGREDSDLPEHAYWSVGSSFALTDRVSTDLRWHDTDADGDRFEGRLVAGLRATF